MEKELLALLKDIQQDEEQKFDTEKAANSLKVTEDTVLFFLSRLIKDKKIKVTALELNL